MKPRTSWAAAGAALLLLTACQDVPFTPDTPATSPVSAAPSGGGPRTGWIYGPDGSPMEVRFDVEDGWAIFQGDINLGRADSIAATREALTRSGGPRYGVYIDGSSKRWPSGTVPYVIDASFTTSQRQTILNAMSHVAASVGGVRFQARTTETSYVVFASSTGGCNSHIGRQSTTAPQTISLPGWCVASMGHVSHEILHALGMWHEQSRCDRDSYVTVHLGNVESGEEHNFDKHCTGGTDVFAYNEGSIMHYGTHGFSANGQATLSSKRGLDSLMGQRSGLAQTDASTINWIYTPFAPQNVSVTNSGGYTSVTWSPSGGATHYSFTLVTVREYRDWTGAYWSTETRGGTSSISGTSAGGDPYTGQDYCVLFENMYEVEDETYWYEIRAHFPDGISGVIGRWGAPVGDC